MEFSAPLTGPCAPGNASCTPGTWHYLTAVFWLVPAPQHAPQCMVLGNFCILLVFQDGSLEKDLKPKANPHGNMPKIVSLAYTIIHLWFKGHFVLFSVESL
jgi:hypothetical protein